MSRDDGKKHEYYDFLVYPESAPDGWEKALKASHAMFAISPLHDPDEEMSKPHYHVIYKHPGPALAKTVLAFLQEIVIDPGIAANGYIEITHHPKGYMRYLLHLDDLEKQQFEGGRQCVTILNGFPYDLTRDLTQEQKREVRKKIFNFIKEFSVTEYSELIDNLYFDDDMLDYACNHTIMFNAYLGSKRHSEKER